MTVLRRFRSVVGTKADVETEDQNVVGSPAEKDEAHFADEIITKDEEKPSADAQNGSVTINALTPFATSSFAASSLLTVIQIVAGSLGSAVYIPMPKAPDLWGRAEGFLLIMSLAVLGIIVVASS
ncbi:hypothetical protein MY11210_004229 [Beauveria gryllotalpidicola]